MHESFVKAYATTLGWLLGLGITTSVNVYNDSEENRNEIGEGSILRWWV